MRSRLGLAALLMVVSLNCTTLKFYEGWRLGYFPQPDSLQFRRTGEYMIQPDGDTILAITFMERSGGGFDSQVYATVLIEIPSDSLTHPPVTLVDPVAVVQRRRLPAAMVTEERAKGGRVFIQETKPDAVHVLCDLEFASGRFAKHGRFKRSANPREQLWPTSICPDSLSNLRLHPPAAEGAKQ